MNADKMYSPDAENAIIASFIIDEDTRYLIETLKTTDFYDPTNRGVFHTIYKLYRSKKPIDLLTINEASGVDMSRLITYDTPTTANIEYHINLLKDKAVRREFAAVQLKINKLLGEDISRVELKNAILKLLDEVDTGSFYEDGSLKKVLMDTFEELQKKEVAHQSGINELDKRTGGFHKGEMTCIAARPSRGKTALGLQIAQGMAWKGLKVLIVSREMSKVQLGKRIFANTARVDGFRLRSNNLNNEDWQKVNEQLPRICDLPIVIDTKSATVPEAKARARKEKSDIVIIDYLQLLNPTNKEKSREREVADMSRELKSMTLDMDIPVVILSQLNRNAEGKRPTMADLRESGAIEQDCDNIVFLHQPTSSEIDRGVKSGKIDIDLINFVKHSGWDLMEFIIAKQRNGATGLFYMIYENKYLTFIDIWE